MRLSFAPLIALVAVLAAVAGCSPFTALNAVVDEDGFGVTSGVRYGPSARQLLDVYVPNQANRPMPVVVFFYGGSWRQGERADYLFAAEALASRGYIAVVADYRLYPSVRFPAFVEDGAMAVRWALDNAIGLGGDPERVYLMGHSAGAHIAAMLSLDERYLATAGVDTRRIRGTIVLAGPSAFIPSRTANIAPIFADLADQNAARPIAFVDGDEPPMLLLHGDDDNTVFLFNTLDLTKTIRGAGGSVRQVVYPDVGHVGILLALARPFRGIAPVLDDIAAFIDGPRAPSVAAE